MRDMLPDENGKGFSITPGGTFEDTTDYTLSASWLPENCKLVVFVQGDKTHPEVLQSVQRSLMPRPAVVDEVVLSKSGSQVCLTWSEVTKGTDGLPLAVDCYRVYRDTSRYYLPGSEVLLDSTTATIYWDDAAGHVGDTEANCFYYVTAVAKGMESAPSLVVGEIDKSLFK
jgi:fibronectin type 3 domain-containing protein